MSEDPEFVSFAMFARAPSIARNGGRRRAERMLDRAIFDAESLTAIRAGLTTGAETFWLLNLMLAHFAAREEDADKVHAHLDAAVEVAVLTGERNSFGQHFGPTNVQLWRVAIGAELGEGPEVAERLEQDPIDLSVLDSRDRSAVLHFDLARAYAQAEGAGDDRALRNLDLTDRLAPQRIRQDPIARDIVTSLSRRAHRGVWELDALRNRFGIT